MGQDLSKDITYYTTITTSLGAIKPEEIGRAKIILLFLKTSASLGTTFSHGISLNFPKGK
jgi:hypothetical protein